MSAPVQGSEPLWSCVEALRAAGTRDFVGGMAVEQTLFSLVSNTLLLRLCSTAVVFLLVLMALLVSVVLVFYCCRFYIFLLGVVLADAVAEIVTAVRLAEGIFFQGTLRENSLPLVLSRESGNKGQLIIKTLSETTIIFLICTRGNGRSFSTINETNSRQPAPFDISLKRSLHEWHSSSNSSTRCQSDKNVYLNLTPCGPK